MVSQPPFEGKGSRKDPDATPPINPLLLSTKSCDVCSHTFLLHVLLNEARNNRLSRHYDPLAVHKFIVDGEVKE